jgi:hypothetical protein
MRSSIWFQDTEVRVIGIRTASAAAVSDEITDSDRVTGIDAVRNTQHVK